MWKKEWYKSAKNQLQIIDFHRFIGSVILLVFTNGTSRVVIIRYRIVV